MDLQPGSPNDTWFVVGILALFYIIGLLMVLRPKSMLEWQNRINSLLYGITMKWTKKTIFLTRVFGLLFLTFTISILLIIFH